MMYLSLVFGFCGLIVGSLYFASLALAWESASLAYIFRVFTILLCSYAALYYGFRKDKKINFYYISQLPIITMITFCIFFYSPLSEQRAFFAILLFGAVLIIVTMVSSFCVYFCTRSPPVSG